MELAPTTILAHDSIHVELVLEQLCAKVVVCLLRLRKRSLLLSHAKQ